MLILKIRQVADVEFNGIEKVHEGAFINRYNLTYTTKDNKKKVYEMISRNRNIDSEDQIRNPKTDGVVIIMTDEDDEHILLNREFRMGFGHCYLKGITEGITQCKKCRKVHFKAGNLRNYVKIEWELITNIFRVLSHR